MQNQSPGLELTPALQGSLSGSLTRRRWVPFIVFAFQPHSKACATYKTLDDDGNEWDTLLETRLSTGARLSSLLSSESRFMSPRTSEAELGPECSLGMFKTLGLIPTLNKPSLVVCACNLTTQEAQVGESEVERRPWLYSKLQASVGYMRQ